MKAVAAVCKMDARGRHKFAIRLVTLRLTCSLLGRLLQPLVPVLVQPFASQVPPSRKLNAPLPADGHRNSLQILIAENTILAELQLQEMPPPSSTKAAGAESIQGAMQGS
jgi:hypothetical protein